MSRTGRAVVYDAPNAPFQVREYPVRDVRPGEVLVRITMSTICRSDIHSYQGHRPNPDRKSTRLNSSHSQQSRMPSSA